MKTKNTKTPIVSSLVTALVIASVSAIGIQNAVADGTNNSRFYKKFKRNADFVAKADSSQITNPPSDDFGNSAVAKLSFDKYLSKLEYTIIIDGLDLNSEIPALHIHKAPPGVNGPHVLNVFGMPCTADMEMSYLGATGSITGAWDDRDKMTEAEICTVRADLDEDTDGPDTDLLSENIEALCAGELYVNIHSTNSTAGELRGQFEPTRSGKKICRKLGFYE